MKTLKLLLLLFSIGILGAHAEDTDISNVDNTLYIENVTVEKGTQVTLSLKMKNNLSITGFQCNLYFPEGVTVQKDEDDYPLIELSTERTTARNTNIFEAVEQADGSMMILANSTKSKSFTGTDGEVATITLNISSDISSGAHTASIKEIALSDVTGVSHETANVNFTITVKADEEPVEITANNYTIKYGDDLPDFGYTSTGAELKGVPAISCEATSSSPVGTYDIVVSKGTVENTIVTFVKGTLTIEKAPLTITAKSYTRKQGEANPTFEVEYEGFKNSETESVLTKKPTVTCSATASSAPGEYDIIPSGASATNYEISYVNGKLTVTSADPVTITAKSYTIKYGDAIPTFEYETTGAALSGTPQITCTATSTSSVGTYDIVVSKGTVSNYNVTYVKGTLTIEKAPLIISGGTYTMKQGDALPTLKAEYSGFKNGETEAVLTKKPTLTTTATSSSAPGEYEVKVSGAEAKNYEISYKAGKITVIQADAVVVTAKSYTIEYGEALPKFEYSSEGAALTGTPEITCSATATSPVGTYDIIVKKGSVTNYNVTYVKGTLTIKKAPLTISGGTYTMKQGDAFPTLKAEYSGFKNGETEAVLTKKPTLTTTATSVSAPGEYEVKVSGAEAKNYEISYKPGKITVIQNNHDKDLKEMLDECYAMKSKIDEIYSQITDGKEFIPSLKNALDNTFSGMRNDIESMLTAITKIQQEELSEEDYQRIRSEYDELMQKISDENTTSPLFTFPRYIQSGTFSCNEGGCILIDNTLEIRNEKKTLYSFYPKAFGNNYDNKYPEFSISLVPDNGYRLANFKMDGIETSKTTFDCFDAACDFVATFEHTGSDGIESVLLDGKSVNIYNLQGKMVRNNAKDFIGLPKGVYIVNGRKVMVK